MKRRRLVPPGALIQVEHALDRDGVYISAPGVRLYWPLKGVRQHLLYCLTLAEVQDLVPQVVADPAAFRAEVLEGPKTGSYRDTVRLCVQSMRKRSRVT
jgi:hypothetical protein